MKLTEVTANQSSKILNESWETLTEAQQTYMIKSERELWPLMEQLVKVFEAELTASQIQQIFADAEKVAMASGNNKSALGKVGSAAKLPVDVMKAVNAKINELGKMAQKTGPVAGADAKVEQLKKDITKSNPKLASKIEAVSDWVKANPKKASLGVAILTAAAAFAAGPAGGAAVGFLLRSTNEMLKGEKLSTAAGKAAKTAAVGALAGMALDNLGDAVLDNFAAASDAEIEGMMDDIQAANLEDAMADIDPTLQALFPELEGAITPRIYGHINGFVYDYDVVLTGDELETFNEYRNSLKELNSLSKEMFSDEYYQEAAKFHDFMAGVQNDPMQGPYRAALDALDLATEAGSEGGISVDQWDTLIDKSDELSDKLNALSKADDTIAATIQGATQQADTLKDKAIKVSKPKEPEQGELDLSQRGDTPVNKNFNKNQKLSAFGKVGDQAESMSMADKMELFLAEADPRQGELGLDNPNTLGAKLKRGVKGAAGKVAGAAKGAASAAGAKAKSVGKELGNKVTANKLMKAWKAAGSPTDTGSIANILGNAGMSVDNIASIGQQNKVDLKSKTVQPVDANGDGKDDTTGKPMPKQTTNTVNLKSLAAEIQKAGVADAVKAILAKG